MKDRKKTPDLLGMVMLGNIDDHKEINLGSNKEIKQGNLKEILNDSNKESKPVSHLEIKPESNKEVKQEEELKEKATFNLSKKILVELEDEWLNIRRAFGGNKRITKTLIVEVAVEMALEDFKHREQNSKFYSKLSSHKAIKPANN
jgi:hypothetical protein